MFTKEDLGKYYGMKKIMSEGSFDIKGEATVAVASFFIWFGELENRIKADIEKSKDIKPVGEPKPCKKD